MSGCVNRYEDLLFVVARVTSQQSAECGCLRAVEKAEREVS